MKQIGVLPVKMVATDQSEKRLVLLGFAEEALGLLALPDDGMMRIAMGKCGVARAEISRFPWRDVACRLPPWLRFLAR
jgi:hypothetical protein